MSIIWQQALKLRGVAVLLLRCLGHFVDLVYTLDQVVFLLPKFGGQVQL